MRHRFLPLLLCACLAAAAGAPAQDDAEAPPPKKPGVRITFLPPPLEGTFSLGIFDKTGRLVRTLHREATLKDFTIGLNGLITAWDGLTDEGTPAAPGTYSARGYAVGAVEFEGEAFHLNDWILEDGAARLKSVMEVQAGPDGAWLALGRMADESLATFTLKADGKPIAFKPVPAPEDFAHPMNTGAAEGEAGARWAELRAGAEKFTGGQPVEALGGEDVVLARCENRLLVFEKGVWRWLTVPGLVKPVHACLGRAGTFWVIDQAADGIEVKQYSLAGEFQRRLAVAKGDPMPRRIASGVASDTLLLVEEAPGTQRVRMLALVASEPGAEGADGSSTWQVSFSRSVTYSEAMATTAPLLKTSAGTPFVPEEKITLRLLPNQLERNAPANADLAVGWDAHGSFLKTRDGLALKTISETPGLKWAAIMREPGGRTVSVFQSDGGVVEEFKARKLASMMAFNAGEYDWNGKL